MTIEAKIIGLSGWLLAGKAALDTEFLGDLYQQHCEAARKGRALVQTPKFVRDLILDRTLGELLRTWGPYAPCAAKTIDPSCGCGHFLVDAFRMTFAAWMGMDGSLRDRVLRETGDLDQGAPIEAIVAQVALDQVVGVDLDPVCCAISRLRLLFEAWAVSDVRMPFRIHVYEGDALLHHRPRPDDEARFGPFPYDVAAVRAALRPGQYTAVVANPPYIACKDAKLRDAYRERYPTCHGASPLYVPFMEVIFGLARPGKGASEARHPTVQEHQGTLFALGEAS